MTRRLVTSSTVRTQGGFTISEFVLVLVFVVGLVTVAVVSVNGIGERADERECQTELRAIKVATEQFKAEVTFYPPDDKALEDANILRQDETPNWRVVTTDQDEGPTYVPEGDRCR